MPLLSNVDAVMETATESGSGQTHTDAPGKFFAHYIFINISVRVRGGSSARPPVASHAIGCTFATRRRQGGKRHTARADAHNGCERVPTNYNCPSLEMGYTSMTRSVAILFIFGGKLWRTCSVSADLCFRSGHSESPGVADATILIRQRPPGRRKTFR